MTTAQVRPITQEDLDRLFEQLKNWGRWGADDQRGALNLITPEKRRRAASLVRDGVTVSAALPLATVPGPDNPTPVTHTMLRAGDVEGAAVTADYFAIAPHGMANTHLDALCHIFHNGQMYNGFPGTRVTSAGAMANSIEAAQDGVVSRGVLLDIAHAKGVPWLEPGEAIYVEDLEAAEKAANVRVEEGDVLLVRTGRHRRREEVGPWATREGLAGLHGSCLPWLRERGVAVLGCDGVSDVFPSGLEGGMGMPIHVVAIVAMGVHLIDNCQLEDLSRACVERGRWEFLFAMAPLKLLRGTASPVNPLAIF